MDLNDAAALAEQLMKQHRLRGWSFRFNRRKRALGLCVYAYKRIELSMYFVHQNDEAAVRDTVLHEIAHAIAGHKAGHGPKWKQVCVAIGAKPERLDREATMPRGGWVGTCQSCQTEHHRHRRPMKGRTYYCKRCGHERGKITFRRVELNKLSQPSVESSD